jgi:ferredoxin
MNVRIAAGCTACRLCEAVAPGVFEVARGACVARPEGRFLWEAFAREIREAAEACPVGVIEVEDSRPEGILMALPGGTTWTTR